jgi:microcystin degradation protein MlrC
VLEGLLSRNFANALVAGIADLPATERCYQHAPGSRLSLRIGASLDTAGSRPIEVEGEVFFLLPTNDPRQRQAVVKIQDVTVVLTAARRPFHNISDFTRLQLHIPGFKLLVVKSGYLSPELASLANPKLPKNQLRPPTFPFDRSFSWQPSTIVSARSPRETR